MFVETKVSLLEIMTPILFALGLALIFRGGGWFADGAVGIAGHTGLPKAVIGASIVSIATTVPEFVVSIVAVLEGSVGTSVGNAIGSVIANIGLILSIAVLITPLKRETSNVIQVWSLIIISIVFALLAWDLVVTRLDAALLYIILALYIGYQLRAARRSPKDSSKHQSNEPSKSPSANPASEEPVKERSSLRRDLLLFLVGTIAVVIGSRLIVTHGVDMARALGVSELIIGLTFVAVGTSLPELVTAVTSAKRGHIDLAAGNLLGASALNYIWVLPGAAIIRPLQLDPNLLKVELPLSLALMALLAVSLMWRKSIGRFVGGLMLLIYGSYVAYLFL